MYPTVYTRSNLNFTAAVTNIDHSVIECSPYSLKGLVNTRESLITSLITTRYLSRLLQPYVIFAPALSNFGTIIFRFVLVILQTNFTWIQRGTDFLAHLQRKHEQKLETITPKDFYVNVSSDGFSRMFNFFVVNFRFKNASFSLNVETISISRSAFLPLPFFEDENLFRSQQLPDHNVVPGKKKSSLNDGRLYILFAITQQFSRGRPHISKRLMPPPFRQFLGSYLDYGHTSQSVTHARNSRTTARHWFLNCWSPKVMQWFG